MSKVILNRNIGKSANQTTPLDQDRQSMSAYINQ